MGRRYDPNIIPTLEVLNADGRFLDVTTYGDDLLTVSEIRTTAQPDANESN